MKNDTRRMGDPRSEPLAMSWRGAWSADLKYAPGEVVSFDGAAYIAERDVAETQPDPWCEDECRWAPLAGRPRRGA
jgi:hypothetical protein